MSVFRVALNNQNQGKLDVNMLTGAQRPTSLQRTVYLNGPGLNNALMKDGDRFTACNYFKQFCYPQVPMEQAILVCETDDGSVYSPIPGENTFPKVYNLSVVAGKTYTDAGSYADILGDTAGYAVFAQITNTHASQDVKIQLNGNADAVIDLPYGHTQVFNAGDLAISKIAVDNSTSGATGPVVVQILVSVKSPCGFTKL
jgi:hypothetical protein